MPNACILTDSTAQFTQPNFPGLERVHIIPFDLQIGAQQEEKSLPCNERAYQRLVPPSPQAFIQFYARLSREYDSILVLTLSSLLNPAMEHALSASMQDTNHATVEVVDSQTTAIGLGMLVQAAAGVASTGASLTEIERRLRAIIPHLYILFCIPELTYLAHSGYMSYAQALVGEMMGMLPIFTIEEGRLAPVEKVRTPRHLFEAFQDFVSEFESPVHIALVHSAKHNMLRKYPLRQYVQDTFPETLYSEHSLQPHLAALFGPQSIGLIVMETVD